MVEARTTHEALFTDDDRDDLLALTVEEDVACPGCGLPLDETTDEEHPYTYDSSHAVCIACEEKTEYMKPLAGEDGRLPPGMLVSVAESTERVDMEGGEG